MNSSNQYYSYRVLKASWMSLLTYMALMALTLLFSVLASSGSSLYVNTFWFVAGTATFAYVIALQRSLPSARGQVLISLPLSVAVMVFNTPILVEVIFAVALLIMAAYFYRQFSRLHAEQL